MAEPRSLIVQGMHGMGDCLHQRAVIRQLIASGYWSDGIWLETSWPSIYHDFRDLKFLRRPVALRTQTKNATREMAKFTHEHPRNALTMRVMYHGNNVMKTESGTVLEAMCHVTGANYAEADYSLPVPAEWLDDPIVADIRTRARLSGKPLLVYRPLVARPEWRGSMGRNAKDTCYVHLFAFLRDHFFVVSVADLEPGKEWIVGPQLRADATLHKGELTFEALAGLYRAAALVWCSSGFSAILGPAVGTPTISIVGGYETTGAHDSGKRHAPFLSIGPKKECMCWSSGCNQQCDRQIDMSAAVGRLHKFIHGRFAIKLFPRVRGPEEMFDPAPVAKQAAPFPPLPPTNSQNYALLLQMQRQRIRDANRGDKA